MTGAAVLGRLDLSRPSGDFNDQGKKFFEDFDPNACATMEVIDYDPVTAQVLPFKVTYQNGKWTIPSHYDYPADAKQRLVDTATGVVGLTKDSIRSDLPEDHKKFEVIDPLDTKANTLTGIGKRVTLKDASDKVLADFIIGKEVKNHPDQRYVRVPGQNRTYGVNVKVDLSTRFADWIETNLLKLDVARVNKVEIDHKGFNPDTGRVVPGEVITLTRKDSSTPWTIEPPPEAGKEPNTESLLALATALGDLKIAGIRPKPEGLTDDLKQAPGEVKPTTRQAWASMVNRGFYLTREGLYSNKGEVRVSTDEGVVYTLRYGEVFIGTGNELSNGAEQPKDAKALAKAAGKESTSEGRYLFVVATFDPGLIPPPRTENSEDEKFPDDPFAYESGETSIVPESAAAKAKAAKLQADRDKLVADAKKRADELSDRFAPWYYVTPGESYKTIMASRDQLVRAKGARPATPPPGGRPGGFDPASFGLPPGPHGD
jgi:hypothetical protein